MKIAKEILSLALLFFIACDGKKEVVEDLNTVILDTSFDIGDRQSPMSLSEIIDSVSYIPIQSEIIIGNIGDVRYYNHRYYIHDTRLMALYIIDETGHIINSISDRGRARNEYITFQSFDVNPTNGEINLYDSSVKRIQVYSNDCTFLRSIPVNDVVRDFAVLNNNEYLFYTPDFMETNRRGLWRVNEKGKFKEQLVSIDDDFLYGGLYPKYFRRIDNTTIGLMGGEDFNRVSHITTDTIIVKYKVNMDIAIPKELLSRPILNFNNYKGIVYTKNDYFETENLMALTVTDMERQILMFYNKQNNTLHQIKRQEDFIDDMDTYGKFQSCDNNKMIGVLYPEVVLAYPSVKKRFPNITTESNPVLVISHMK